MSVSSHCTVLVTYVNMTYFNLSDLAEPKHCWQQHLGHMETTDCWLHKTTGSNGANQLISLMHLLWAICIFSNGQIRKSRYEEDSWRFWWVCCSVHAEIRAARPGNTREWTRGTDTPRRCASGAVISQESHECTVCKYCGYLWVGRANTPVSIWGTHSSLLCCRFLIFWLLCWFIVLLVIALLLK